MQERDIEPSLYVRPWHAQRVLFARATLPCRVQEETSMGIERGGFDGIDDNLGGVIFVWHIDGSYPIFALDAAVPSYKLAANILLLLAVLVETIAAISTDYRK